MSRTQLDNNTGSEIETGPNQNEEPKSPETQQLVYTRRYPRIGGQFQTRIPKDEPSCRPVPDRFSVDYPHLSMKEADIDQGNSVLSKDGEASNPQHGNGFTGRGEGDIRTARGGLLIHSPFDRMEEFPSFVRPLLVSQQDEPESHIVKETWKQQMIQLHSCEMVGGKRSRASRGGVKRKRADPEDQLIWSLEHILERQEGTGKRKGGEHELFGEEDAFVFEELKRQHDGNVRAAQLNLLVQLSGGKAVKMRKYGEKLFSKQKSKSFSTHTSDSWREMYERMKLTSILGQLQNDSVIPYNFNTHASTKSDGGCDINLALTDDDLKDAWRSILACGKSLERQLSTEGETEKKPLLSTLITFIGNSCGLPAPESCFGTHHVVVEEVSHTMGTILAHVEKAQQVLANLRDLLFDGTGEGIDSDNLLKFLDTECKSLPFRLREVDDLYAYRIVVVEWESRVVALLDSKDEEPACIKQSNSLRAAERLQSESKSHGYISKPSVQLDNRIQKAYELRDRIMKWKNVCLEGKKFPLRQLSSLMKEVVRVRLIFPEASGIVDLHQAAESWIDRANIAIRSKMALDEIRELILRAETIPLDFSEYLEKLKARVRSGEEWLELLAETVPSGYPNCGHLELMESFRVSLQSGNYSKLHELASDGSRIPVDVDAIKLLQVALDAKNWTSKAQKWIPSNPESKKGKLFDLREHIEKASMLREKLPLPEEGKSAWTLESEKELSEIIEAADAWSEKYKSFLEGDNRKNEERSCISIEKLRTIVEEGNAIYVNIGNTSSKICRILAQAETWCLEHDKILTRCNLLPSSLDGRKDQSLFFLDILDIAKAVEAAKSDVALDLEEAMKLRELLQKVNEWRERVLLIAPKRSKRNGRAARSKFTVDDLVGLIQEAPLLPINTLEEVNRLQVQLSSVEIWRAQAVQLLEMIVMGFHQLHSFIDEEYGPASTFSIDRLLNGDDSDSERSKAKSSDNNLDDTIDVEELSNQAKRSGAEDCFTSGSEDDVISTAQASDSNLDVLRLIKELQENAYDVIVTTEEGELGDLLDSVANWCIRSFKYLNSPRQVFDKRFVGAFDRFLSDGVSLRVQSSSGVVISDSPNLRERLGRAWGTVVSELLERLQMMKKVSEQHFEWCENAAQILSDEKKLTFEKLNDLAENSRNFPASSDMVSKVRGLSVKVAKWVEKMRKLFISGNKLSMQEGKTLLDAGEKLRVNTQELRTLKSELRAALGWSNKVKKCNLDHGSVHIGDVNQLIAEHDSLLIEFPEEVEELKLATIRYCICRRPYEGFMIGCDSCEEWYHGPCIGISESRADKFENFTCIRCSTKKVFESSASVAVALVRKWTSNKDLKKARQVEYQKLQRKFRKERKDVEKMAAAVKEAERKLLGHLHCKVDSTARPVQLSQAASVITASTSSSLPSTDGNQSEADSKPGILADLSADEADGTGRIITTKNETNCPEQRCDNEPTSTVTTPPGIVPSDNVNLAPESNDGKESRMLYLSFGRDPPLTSHVTRIDDIAANVEKAKTALKQAKERADLVSIQSKERKLLEAREDDMSSSLRRWFLRVRSLVLLPSKESLAEAARPVFGKLVSPPMVSVITDAHRLGISDLPDVHTMINCFKCLSWSLSTLEVIGRKPSISEISALVAMVSGFKLPDEKALKTLKFMLSRATQLQARIVKAVVSKPGETKTAQIPFLMELDASSDEVPLIIPEKQVLKAAINDNGKNSSKGLSLKQEENSCCREVSPHAPDHVKLWPPFGVLGSQAALEALGKECSAIPDETCELVILDQKISEQHRGDAVVTPSLEPATPTVQNESPGVVISSQTTSPNQIQVANSAENSVSGVQQLAVVDHEVVMNTVESTERTGGALPGPSLDTADPSPTIEIASWKAPPVAITAPLVNGCRDGEISSTQLTSLSSDIEEAASDIQERDYIPGIVETLPSDAEQGIVFQQQADFHKLTHVANGIAVEDGTM